MDLEELAPRMSPASDLVNRARLAVWQIQVIEPGIAVGMEMTGEAGQMIPGMFALAVRAVVIDRCRRSASPMGALVAGVDPQPPGSGAPGTRGQHRDRRVIAMQDR